MKKLLVVQVAALGRNVATRASLPGFTFLPIDSIFPAVTCTVQASFRTALAPSQHGMVSNGYYVRDFNRPFFWEQSSRLVAGPRIWESFRARGKKVAMLFWQQSLGDSVDLLLSPAPIHKHHGGMIPACYSKPGDLYERLCRKVGRRFALQHYWGPLATTRAGDWIVDAAAGLLADDKLAPDLCLVYLPSLDYDLQRFGPESSQAQAAITQTMEQLRRLVESARTRDYDCLIFGDYEIAAVSRPIFPNRILADGGFLATRNVQSMLYPDLHASRAFAMVDHEIAHVYVPNPDDVASVRELLRNYIPEQEPDRHANSGELVLVAGPEEWFAYPWWHESCEAPEYASHVDIHNKPGYDPCELFFATFPWKTSQDATRIKGSHGCVGPKHRPVWAATCDLGEPTDIVELSAAVRKLLEKSS